MCGIAGWSGAFDPRSLALMSAAIAHRGPDGDGEFVDVVAGIGLAHRRLSIIDLAPTGAQPMTDSDGLAVIVFNGEIYNYRELREELTRAGVAFRGTSDTEVLLHLYLREGLRMLPRLNGIFAFAIWDTRSRELVLARDALGVKPLYVHESRRGLAFASELKALLPVMGDDRALDAAALRRYLSFLWCPGEATPFRSVRKLGPGEVLVIRNGRAVRREAWYRLPSTQAAAPAPADPVAAVADALRTATHRQLVADVPVGAFLSGGLDSSAVVAFAREREPGLRCFTIDLAGGQEQGMADDLPYARAVARHLDVRLDVVTVDASAMAADLPRMVEALDEPLADPAPLNVLYISELARRNGIKVLLSGAGGDDLFTGYRRHVAVRVDGALQIVPGFVRRGAEAGARLLGTRLAAMRRATKFAQGLSLDGDERLVGHFRWLTPGEAARLCGPALATDSGDAGQPMYDFLQSVAPSRSSLDRMLALEQRFFLADHNLIYTDKMSMAAGVEARVPFLDLDLVALAARIPERVKQHGREGKWVLKKAMEPWLPREIIYRPKTGFGAPLRRWLHGELRTLLEDLLSADSLRRRGLFDPAAVHDLLRRHDAGRIDAAYTLLSLLVIELWCRAFVDRPTGESS